MNGEELKTAIAEAIAEQREETTRNLGSIHSTESEHMRRALNRWGRVGTTVLAALAIGLIWWLFDVRDGLQAVEALPDVERVRELIQTSAPWVADKPHITRRMDSTDAAVARIEVTVGEIDDAVDDLRVEQRTLILEVLSEVKKGNGS